MMKIWVCVDDKNFEFLIKNFIEDLYGIAPSFIETCDYVQCIDEIEKNGSNNVVIVDHDDLAFKGYVIQLCRDHDRSDHYIDDKDKRRESTIKRQYIDFKKNNIYKLVCALDDIWDDLKKGDMSSLEQDFLQIPIRHYDIAMDSGVELFEYISDRDEFKSKDRDTHHIGHSIYIKKMQSEPFYQLLEKRLLKKLNEKNKSITIHCAQDLAAFIGISEITIKQVDNLYEGILEDCLRQDDLKMSVRKLMLKDSSYESLTKLMMYTTVHTCRQNKTFYQQRIFKKMITASLFRDISLHSEELKMMIDLDHHFSRSSREDRLKIRHHPLESSELLNRYSMFSQDEVLMIERHHEKPDGSGFPKGLTASHLQPMQCLFNTCYRFSHYLLLECSSLVTLDHRAFRSTVSKMVSEGYAKEPLRRYFSILASNFMDDK